MLNCWLNCMMYNVHHSYNQPQLAFAPLRRSSRAEVSMNFQRTPWQPFWCQIDWVWMKVTSLIKSQNGPQSIQYGTTLLVCLHCHDNSFTLVIGCQWEQSGWSGTQSHSECPISSAGPWEAQSGRSGEQPQELHSSKHFPYCTLQSHILAMHGHYTIASVIFAVCKLVSKNWV